MKNIVYKRAESIHELQGILDLQKKNSPNNISESEKTIEGFVTVQHDMEVLKKMNDKSAHIIAKYDDKVIGYALVMLKDFKDDISVLRPMFSEIDKIKNQASYVTMGQVCVAKEIRKQGVFSGLYHCMKFHLKDEFSMVITAVDRTNTRSISAHFAVGFKHLKTYHSLGQDWELIYWDWT